MSCTPHALKMKVFDTTIECECNHQTLVLSVVVEMNGEIYKILVIGDFIQCPPSIPSTPLLPLPTPSPLPALQHDMSFSPHNAQLCLLHNSSLHAFFSLAQHPARGLVLAYHVLPSCEVHERETMQGKI